MSKKRPSTPQRRAPHRLSPRDWVRAYGYGAPSAELALICGCSEDDVAEFRKPYIPSGRNSRLPFDELFELYHGRPPTDDEWPAPVLRKTYAWQPREDAVLAGLAAGHTTAEIAAILTQRLRKVTNDAKAERTAGGIYQRLRALRLSPAPYQATEISAGDAGREIQNYSAVSEAIRHGRLPARKEGSRLVIARSDWERWKSLRLAPVEDAVLVSELAARMGMKALLKQERRSAIPEIFFATRSPEDTVGRWYVPQAVAQKLVADRQAGRPMPWFGQAQVANLQRSYAKWKERQHPEQCVACGEAWGATGAPQTFEDYCARYPALSIATKRHLTARFIPGLRIIDVVRRTGMSSAHVSESISQKQLKARRQGGVAYCTEEALATWMARGAPSSPNSSEWLSLAQVRRMFGLAPAQVDHLVSEGLLRSKVEQLKLKEVTVVNRADCLALQESVGVAPDVAARLLGISVSVLGEQLSAMGQRSSSNVAMGVIKLIDCALRRRHGCTLEEAAEALGETAQWVRERIADGTVRAARDARDRRRQWITTKMMERLRRAQPEAPREILVGGEWLTVGRAAGFAGVTSSTIAEWAAAGEIESQQEVGRFRRYRRSSVKKRARRFWRETLALKPNYPAWFIEEQERHA